MRKLLGNREKAETEKKQEIYLDKSFIHQNYCRYDDCLFEPNDEQDIQTRKPNEGRRICFLAAIKYKSGESNSGSISNSFWHSIPSSKHQKGDYP